MRFIGQCELAVELMTERALGRIAFGKPLSDRETIREWIALSRMEIDQACPPRRCAWPGSTTITATRPRAMKYR